MLLPRKIVYRHKLDFTKHCKAQFGTYCEAHNKPVPTNTMVTQSTPAILLSPTVNQQGTYKFFSLATGKKIKQQKMTAYPMPDAIIKMVEQFDKANATPNAFNFLDRNRVLFEWNNKVDECLEGIIKKDMVLYSSLAAEISVIIFDQDQPIPSIETI
jgi:hypothetical protein